MVLFTSSPYPSFYPLPLYPLTLRPNPSPCTPPPSLYPPTTIHLFLFLVALNLYFSVGLFALFLCFASSLPLPVPYLCVFTISIILPRLLMPSRGLKGSMGCFTCKYLCIYFVTLKLTLLHRGPPWSILNMDMSHQGELVKQW